MTREELILEIIEKVHDSVERLNNRVNELQIEQVRQGEMHVRNTLNVEEHVRRSNLLEESIELVRDEIRPLQKHVDIVQFIGKVMMWAIGSGGIIFIIKIFLS